MLCLFVLQVSVGDKIEEFFTIPGRDGPSGWDLVQHTYAHVVEGTFSFIIQGTVGNATGRSGDSIVAIDDYSLAMTACPQVKKCNFNPKQWTVCQCTSVI